MVPLLKLCAGAVLSRLGIKYRELPCGNGVLYLCRIPANGYTFDMKCDNHGVIRLWRFIGTAPLSKAGSKFEYRNPKQLCSVVGMEVTDEGDVSFYAEQKVDVADVKSFAQIDRMITRYVNMISDVPLALAL